MAQSKQSNKPSSRSSDVYSYSGASAAELSAPLTPAKVLASCYALDATTTTSAAALSGFHYCTTLAAGPECPPLAAITAANQLTLLPKKKQQQQDVSGRRHNSSSGRHRRGAGGATFRIREECERLFCETMAAVFQGERNTVGRVSGLTGVFYDDNNKYNDEYDDNKFSQLQLMTPPDEVGGASFNTLRRALSDASSDASEPAGGVAMSAGVHGSGSGSVLYAAPVAWLEIWDFVGYASFRAFVAEDRAGGRSLFVFFDASLFSRDVKQALVALIELGDTMACGNVVICVDRAAPAEAATEMLKGLQWAGFSLTTLDLWTGGSGVDVTSSRWLFMGMEL